jgi:GNAT superfamily N-acetyltransferase
MAELQLRRMVAADLPAAHALTQALTWSHRLEDWQFHFALGKGWVALNAAGAVLGTILWWGYGERAATLGLVVVDQQAQGHGIGRLLMNVVLKDAGARAFQLMATTAGLKLYQQCGFTALGTVEQRQAVPGATAAPVLPMKPGLQLRACVAGDLPALVQLDAVAFGAPRPQLLAAALQAGSGLLLCRGGEPRGYALLRRSGRGLLIGPLVAEDEDQAIALVASLLQSNPGLVRLDVFVAAARLRAWLDAAGIFTVDRVTPMVRGEWPAAGDGAAGDGRAGNGAVHAQRYGLASQALG